MTKYIRAVSYFLMLLCLSSAASATGVFATLYVAKIKYGEAGLELTTGSSSAVTRALAANAAYREQVPNKTAVPQTALFKISYADGAIEMATVTAPLFTEALILSPGTLVLPQSRNQVSFNSADGSTEITISGTWYIDQLYIDGELIMEGYPYFEITNISTRTLSRIVNSIQ